MAKRKENLDSTSSEGAPTITEGTEGESSARKNEVVTTASIAPARTSTSTSTSSPKAKITERLQRAVDEAPPTKNRSPELIPLTAEYEKMRKNLRNLVALVKNYAETTGQLTTARENVVDHIGMMSKDSPIEQDLSGVECISSETLARVSDAADPTGLDSALQALRNSYSEPSQGSGSLTTVQKLATAQSVANQREFDSHVITWAMEWEQAVTERIDRDLSSVRKLQANRSHYEKKVELLRRKSNGLESKGKNSPRSQVAKLERNEEKLKEAFVRHESEAGRLCTLIETVIQDGWIELYQLSRNYMKWESNRVGRESEIYNELAGVIDSMKGNYTKNAPKRVASTNVAGGGKAKKGGSAKHADGLQKENMVQ